MFSKNKLVKTKNGVKISVEYKKVKKVCPPGKILSPKGRCIIDRGKQVIAEKINEFNSLHSM